MVILWYRNMIQYHNIHNTLPLLEKAYSLLFPVIYTRCEIGRLNFLISQMEKKVKELMNHVSIDSANASISHQLKKLSLKLKSTENRRLDAKIILTKMQNLRLVLGNFPQCIVNISLLVLATTNSRIQKYMVQISDVLSENLKNQATLILNKNFHIIVICLIIKTMVGLILILIKNRYIELNCGQIQPNSIFRENPNSDWPNFEFSFSRPKIRLASTRLKLGSFSN